MGSNDHPFNTIEYNTNLDLYLWDDLKQLFYATDFPGECKIHAQIMEAFETARHCVRVSKRNRLVQACIEESGGYFEHLF